MTVLNFQNTSKADDQGKVAPANRKWVSLHEAAFHETLARERKRSERSKRPLLLMLFEARDPDGASGGVHVLSQCLEALGPRIRETDVIGWHQENKAIGVIFTELRDEDKSTVLSGILEKFNETLSEGALANSLCQISISFHFFPDDWCEGSPSGGSNDTALYPDIQASVKGKKFMLGVKRFMDISLTSIMLLVSSPLFLIIAIAIKATSKGPIFFRQQRVGQYGRHFTFLKFRSMKVNNDCSEHRQYVSKLIAGTADRITTDGNSDGVYKLANDDRTTPLGRLLRRSSLDELPQLVNVLRGDMSLVGPRPPIPYELAVYQTWHRGRLLQVKPGITGLWQISGRNRVTFDNMVRYDLQYASNWSPWLDIKILFRTPAAVLKGAC